MNRIILDVLLFCFDFLFQLSYYNQIMYFLYQLTNLGLFRHITVIIILWMMDSHMD